jgi:hypothetical protein
MKAVVGAILCIGFVLWGASAQAETIYKYRDQVTKRDVFVNGLDQIPQKYRSQAKIVLEGASSPSSTEGKDQTQAPDSDGATRTTGSSTGVVDQARSVETGLREAIKGKNLLKDGPAIACAWVDAKLVKAGTRPLDEGERAQLGSLLTTIFVLSVIAGLFAFIVWIVMMVSAVRDGRLGWAVFMFLFAPLAYVYLFVHAGKGRWAFKLVCAFGMVSPALVGLASAWRFHSWLQAIIQTRGGHV